MKATERPLTDLTGKLPDGCFLPALHERGPGGEYILARWDAANNTEQWVTWFIGYDGRPCDGRYFQKQDEEHEPLRFALDDFRARVAGRS